MCRIAGILDYSHKDNLLCINAMRDSMWRGGPDDMGTYTDADIPFAMAVRRLALLDLSPLGHQPMVAENDDIVLAYNGELYNYLELRAELRELGVHFKTGTDTEVVLAAYRQWGEACFNRFNGMFALCLWNKKLKQILVARDHAGMKPLYYFVDEAKRQFYFASEVRAFKHINPFWPEDENWRVRLLAFGHMPEPHTTLQGVKTLPAGHYLKLSLPHFKCTTQRWYAPVAQPLITDATEARLLLEAALSQAVSRHLVADAPLGIFLSGGTDSSLLTLLAAKQLPPGSLHTVSLVFNELGYSEKKYQDIIVAQSGAKHQSYTISPQDFEIAMPDILAAMDQPSNDGINSYFISKYARAAGLTAVLSGIGADELFGGYDTFKWRTRTLGLQKLPKWTLALASLATDDRLKRVKFLQYGTKAAEYLFYRGFFIPEQIARLLDIEVKQVEAILAEDHTGVHLPKETDNSTYISNMEQQYYLRHQLLRDADAMSMWHSLEVRIPFLDRQVIELCNSVAPAVRFPVPGSKTWLIDTFKATLPPAIWQRKKMGFTFPFHLWTKTANIAGAADRRLFELQKSFSFGQLKWSRYWTYLLSTGQKIGFSPPGKKILFLSLTSFSATGGIEKFNRSLSKALQETAADQNWQVSHFSVYDDRTDPRYFSANGFVGFSKQKLKYSLHLLRQAWHYDIIIAGHINLGVLLWFIGKIYPVKMWCMAHGIEVWQPLPRIKTALLRACDTLLSVSQFTADKLEAVHGVDAKHIRIFPNTIDPYFAPVFLHDKIVGRTALGLPAEAPILLTVARLAHTEKYKGYDDILMALPAIKVHFPNIKYVLAGNADDIEYGRITNLIADLQLTNTVVMTGFVEDHLLPQLYQMADAFVMPSRKEGFGIVFIEAAWCGLPLIAGNQDGSADALLNGTLGRLITPGDIPQLTEAILQTLKSPYTIIQQQAARQAVADHFGYPAFKARLAAALNASG